MSFDELFGIISATVLPSHSIDAGSSIDQSSTACDDSWLSPSASFPQKLFALSAREFDIGETVEWCAAGAAFRIRDPEAFADDILPKYFKRKLRFV